MLAKATDLSKWFTESFKNGDDYKRQKQLRRHQGTFSCFQIALSYIHCMDKILEGLTITLTGT